ncbi:MAG TPA: glycosyltransferase family 39 protein [Verrucomicrobiae bacterium]
MANSEQIQRFIHALEVGQFSRWLRLLPLAVAVIGLAVLYDLSAYRGFNSVEAMDAAQVARNMADGKGYTTDFIRPVSIYLLQKHNQKISATNAADFAQLNGAHPDLANPPVYPTVLAGLMEFWKPNWTVETRKPFWSEGGRFLRYQTEFRIAIMNQILLLVSVALTFLIARKLFDIEVAWLAALLTLGADLLWKFSVSGQSTLLLLVIFLGLVLVLIKIEELGRTEKPPVQKLFMLTVTAGLLVGMGMLTRYAFGGAIIPVAIFLMLFGGVRRPSLAVAAILTFVLAVTPWIIRNLEVSGTLFGTAGYAIAEGTFAYPGSQLSQSINPDPTLIYWLRPYIRKLLENLRFILQNDLLRIGGNWVATLFFAGLLLGLRNIAARRMRYFTMICVGVFSVVQALGKTQLSAMSPEINSENLLVLLAPLAAIFGIVFFLTLLNQMKTPSPQIRLAIIVLMLLIACQPLITSLLPPKISPVAYPPYYPPEIQKVASWMHPDELMMSDIPWAVAWYGDHPCVWLTLNLQPDFYAINDYLKPIKGIYFTTDFMDKKAVSETVRSDENSWGRFIYNLILEDGRRQSGYADALSRGQFAEENQNSYLKHFPLNVSKTLSTGFFFTDRQRWKSQ